MRPAVLAVAGGLALAAALVWYFADGHGGVVNAAANTAANPSALTVNAGFGREQSKPDQAAPLNTAATEREQQLALAQVRYERAHQVYSSYLQATRYPHDSRPISEHPDQIKPFDPASEEKLMRDMSGKPIKGVRLRTTQDRVFMSGNDVVNLHLSAVDEKGQTLPLTITRAAAGSIPEGKTAVQLIQSAVSFNDSGTSPDASAGDGIYSAQLAPAAQGFAAHNGTIRILAQVSANGEQGVAHFDVIYSPSIPAVWTGVREAVEQGSLNFYLKANVKTPGRYVASARVDDAHGKPFALLQFNEEVAQGAQEFRLHLFGALIRDKAPAFPLKLRDVDGFLLYPDQFPDRAMMARQTGVIHSSGQYALDKFSRDDWTSEEKERYLKEYKQDEDNAKKDIDKLTQG